MGQQLDPSLEISCYWELGNVSDDLLTKTLCLNFLDKGDKIGQCVFCIRKLFCACTKLTILMAEINDY